MMHTLRFEQCLLKHMGPCSEHCPRLPDDQKTCESLVKIEMTYYDNNLALIIFDNPIFDRIGPELLRDEVNKAFAPLQKQGIMGRARVFGPGGHAE